MDSNSFHGPKLSGHASTLTTHDIYVAIIKIHNKSFHGKINYCMNNELAELMFKLYNSNISYLSRRDTGHSSYQAR